MLHLAILCLLLSPTHAQQPKLTPIAAIPANGDTSVSAATTDHQGNIYIAGTTLSWNLGTPNVHQQFPGGSNLYLFDGGTATPLRLPSIRYFSALAVDPVRPNRFFAATTDGLLSSTDAGLTWTLRSSLPDIRGITVAPSRPDTVYVVAQLCSPKPTEGAVLRSEDGGQTWRTLSTPQPTTCFSLPISVDPFDPQHILYDGHQSTNGGTTWTRMSPEIHSVTFDPKRRGAIYGLVQEYAAHQIAFYLSTNGGSTWTLQSRRSSQLYGDIRHLLIDPLRPRTIHAVHYDGHYLLLSSSDDGATWVFTRFLPDGIGELTMAPNGVIFATRIGDLISTADLFATTETLPTGNLYYPGKVVYGAGQLLIQAQPSTDAFLAKLSPTGQVIFTTYYGGFADDSASALIIDRAGGIILAGSSTAPGTTGFLARFSPAGDLLATTQLPARPLTLAIDAQGALHFGGTVPFSPPLQTGGVVGKLTPDYASVESTTSWGFGVGGILPDSTGGLLIGGSVAGRITPTTREVLSDIGDTLAMAIGDSGDVYLTGTVRNLTPTSQAFQSTPPDFYADIPLFGRGFPHPVARDAFAARISPQGELRYATLLGAEMSEQARAVAIDSEGNALIGGSTASKGFPTRATLQTPQPATTGFLTKLNPGGSAILYSTYWGSDVRAILPHPQSGYLIAGTDQNKIVVSRLIEEPVPATRIDAVLNHASLLQGSIAPGERILIRGSGFDENTRLTLDTQTLPLLALTNTTIETVIPRDLAPGQTLPLQAADSNIVTITTTRSAPAIYTTDASGRGHARVYMVDGRLNSPENPAAKGARIAILVNGLATGYRDLTVRTYAEATSITVTFGAEYQIIEATISTQGDYNPPGSTVPITLTVDGIPSQPGVFLYW